MMARITSTMVGKILNKMYLYKKKLSLKTHAYLTNKFFYSALLFQKLKKKNFCYNFEDGRKDTSMDGKQVKNF